jgi:hypothetical protein
MTGAASRRRGHDAERKVAAWLRANGYPDAATTRSALGHDGFHAPGDVLGVPGVVIEVKDVKGSAWPTWCRQAEAEAEGRPWIVVRRERGVTDVGNWPCKFNDEGGGVMIAPGQGSFRYALLAIEGLYA